MQRFESKRLVDWFRVLTDLTKQGLKDGLIAAVIGAPRSTLLGWKQGSQPKHFHGERLVELWALLVERPRDEVPMVSVPQWRRRG